MIIQTGSRTDIPAFYADWFANRLREGYVYVRNPYSMAWFFAPVLKEQNLKCLELIAVVV